MTNPIAKLACFFVIIILNGCQDTKDPVKAHDRCLQSCTGSKTPERVVECDQFLTYAEKNCLFNAENSETCPLGQAAPLKSCRDGGSSGQSVPSVPPSSGTSSPELKSVNFNVVKVDLTTQFENVSWAQRMKTIFPVISVSPSVIKSGGLSPTSKLSFATFADLIVERSGVIEYPVGSSYGKVEVRLLLDDWYVKPNNVPRPTGRSLCGNRIQIYGSTALEFEPDIRNPGDALLAENSDWANEIYTSDPSVQAYDNNYIENARKPIQIHAFLFDTEYQFLFKDPEDPSLCFDNPVDDDQIDEFANSNYIQLKAIAAKLSKPENKVLANARIVRGTHTFTVSMFANNMRNLDYFPITCGQTSAAKEWMGFYSVLSHEIGHHFMSIGHDPDMSQLMYYSAACQKEQEFGYTPVYIVNGKKAEITCPPEVECKDPAGYIVNSLRQTKIGGVSPQWVP